MGTSETPGEFTLAPVLPFEEIAETQFARRVETGAGGHLDGMELRGKLIKRLRASIEFSPKASGSQRRTHLDNH